jgi:hypothetical protein
MEDDEKQSKRLLSSDDSENIPVIKHRHLKSRVKTPQLILLCVVFEIAHFLLVWSVYDGVQRVRSPKLPDLDGRRSSAKSGSSRSCLLTYFASVQKLKE